MKNLRFMKITPDMQYEIGQDKVSYFPAWDVKDDETLLNKVKQLAHSTFDLSKFTKVGSPIISDGIVSGFSDSNYLKGATTFNLSGAKWKITVGVILHSTPFSGYESLWHAYGTGTSYFNSLGCVIGTNGKLVLSISDGTVRSHSTANAIEIDKLYITSIEFTGASYIFKVNDTVIGTYAISTEVEGSTNDKTLWLGAYRVAGNAFSDGAIDLKTVEVEINGVSVFSGNKTGIDTIKPDDYTVVGTPTISADGVASGFSGNGMPPTSYIKTPSLDLSVSDGHQIIIEGEGTYVGSTSQRFFSGLTEKKVYLYTTGSSWYFSYNGTSLQVYTSFTSGDKFSVRAEADSGRMYLKIVNISTNTTYQDTKTETLTSAPSDDYFFGGGYNNWQGDINLNAFKIYVDGNLIYQPCLKIPYTEAKNNNKVVDVLYRERVKDLFEQEGYNGYYTVDEENKNFTLPTHQFNDVISYYKNGISVCEQKVDLSLFQQGSCTNGNEVTFIKPFRDTDYVLSIPYSAKSKTAFTPTQSGEWTAYGKTHL